MAFQLANPTDNMANNHERNVVNDLDASYRDVCFQSEHIALAAITEQYPMTNWDQNYEPAVQVQAQPTEAENVTRNISMITDRAFEATFTGDARAQVARAFQDV